MIPRQIVQKTRTLMPSYVVEQLQFWLSPEWKRYEYAGDDAAMQYFDENRSVEFPNIAEKYWTFAQGAHRADLFRFYWLWQNGGLCLDDDMMFTVPIDRVIPNDAVFVTASSDKQCLVGFVGTVPGHPIVHEILTQLYNLDPSKLVGNYLLVCRMLHKIMVNSCFPNVRVYPEYINRITGVAKIKDKETIVEHYFHEKVVPHK